MSRAEIFLDFIETASEEQITEIINGLYEKNENHVFDGLITGLSELVVIEQ